MKQVVQNYRNGKVRLLDVPVPCCAADHLLVRNTYSLISLGTERSMIRLGQKNLLGKARARPDLVRRALEKVKQEGLQKTWQEALGRLETPTPLGYSASGLVVESGLSAKGFSPNDRVAVIGQSVASHAAYLHVPMNMVCRIPDHVSDDAAAFGMLGTIALHGIRKSQCDFGSVVVVMGAGLLGLLSVLFLKAYGCRVAVMDLLPEKISLAEQLGADFASTDFSVLKEYVNASTQGVGVDVCFITTATKSDRPVNDAVSLSRRGGKIIVLGTCDIHPNRNLLWEKECELLVSRAGGENIELPIDVMRWTSQRNLAEFLRLLSVGAMDVTPLITHRFPIAEAEKVYTDIAEGRLSNGVGILFYYPKQSSIEHTISIPSFKERNLPRLQGRQSAGVAVRAGFYPLGRSPRRRNSIGKQSIAVSVMGAGVFAKSLLLPALRRCSNVNLRTLVCASGASAEHSARRFGFEMASTDAYSVFADTNTQAIIAVVPHRLHADLVLKALQQHKPLYIEKPLCVNLDELKAIEDQLSSMHAVPIIQLGHNRRHSPHALKIKSWLVDRQQPLVMQYRVNAGFIAPDHWVHRDAEGRSRIVGELSHFIDFMQYITDEQPQRVFAERVAGDENALMSNDNIVVTIKFNQGSVASLTYTASGNRTLPRECIEIFFEGKSICLNDFCSSRYYTSSGKQSFRTRAQSLGYRESLHHFVDCVRGVQEPCASVSTLLLTMHTVFAIESALSLGKTVCIS